MLSLVPAYYVKKAKALFDSGVSTKNAIEIDKASGPKSISHAPGEAERQDRSGDQLEQFTTQVARGGAIALVGGVIGKIANLGLNVLLTRGLGAHVYGLYALGLSVTGIASSVSSLGLGQGIIRYGAIYHGQGDKARIKSMILSVLTISLVSSILASFLLFTFAGVISRDLFNKPDLTNVLRVFALALPFHVLTGMTMAFAQSLKRIEYQQGINLFHFLTNLALVGAAFLLGFRLAGAMCGVLVSALFSAGLGSYSLWRIFPEIGFVSRATYQCTRLLRFSLPMLLIGFSHIALTYTDRIMLGYFEQSSDVAVYNAAATVAQILTIFLSAITVILSPMISDLHSRGHHKDLTELYKVTVKWAINSTMPFLLILAIFSKPILYVFGIEFVSGHFALRILAFSQFFNSATGPAGRFLQMSGKQNIDLMNGIALIFANIVLNMVLIPPFGVAGAALATCVSIVLIHTLRLIEICRFYRAFPYDKRLLKTIMPTGVAMLIGTVCAKSTSSHWISFLVGPILVLISYCAIHLLQGFDQDDMVILNALKTRTRR